MYFHCFYLFINISFFFLLNSKSDRCGFFLFIVNVRENDSYNVSFVVYNVVVGFFVSRRGGELLHSGMLRNKEGKKPAVK